MKILYVISTPVEYSSSANMRNLALIKGLIENGHEVDLVADDYDPASPYVDKELCRITFRKRYYLRNLNKRIEVAPKKQSIIKTKLMQIASKVLNISSVYDSRRILAKKVYNLIISDKYDYMISSSDPKSSHLIAHHLRKNNPDLVKKWIQYWGDPFLTDINNARILFGKAKTKKEEHQILSEADKIVYVSPFTLTEQQQLYPDLNNKMSFLPIPYYKETQYKKNSTNIIGYFGDYYSRNRNIMPLYNCCKNNNFNIIIMGDSDLKLECNKNIQVFPRQSRKIVEEKEKETELLVCVCNKSGTQIPGKVYHYAATNKPILLIIDGENKEELKKYFAGFDRYYICDNDEDSIKESINSILKSRKDFAPLKCISAKEIAKKIIK